MIGFDSWRSYFARRIAIKKGGPREYNQDTRPAMMVQVLSLAGLNRN
jgi:hypothetical protein